MHHVSPIVFEWAIVVFWLATIVAARGRGRLLRAFTMLALVGFLAGCADRDPLAVASGPLYPLNVGYWQPTQQDLAKPPPIAPY